MKVVFLTLFVLLCCKQVRPQFNTILQWKTLEFAYQNAEQKQQDLNSGFYLPRIPVPFDIDVHYNTESAKRIFMSIPRLEPGSPITLGVYTGKTSSDGVALLEPYPSWDWHRGVENCGADKLVSVWGIKIDECGRLWVLDNGDFGRVTCPRRVLIFDLKTNKVIQQLPIPSNLTLPVSFICNPKVDIRNGNCEDAALYFSDAAGMTIHVYTSKSQKFSTAHHKSMLPDPKYSNVVVAGQGFEVMDGVFGLALEPEARNGDRKLFYSPLTGSEMNFVNTSVLKKQDAFLENQRSFENEFITIHGRRPNAGTSFEIDRNNVAYFGYLRDPSSFHCWNTQSSEYGTYIDTIYTNSTTMQFASGVKVINNPSGKQELWILTSRFHKAFHGPLDVNDVNFRVMIGQIPDILQNTSCMVPNRTPRNQT